MSGWNNEVGGNLLMKNNRGGWNKHGGWIFLSKQIDKLGEIFSLGLFLSQYFHQGLNSVGLKIEVSKLQLN